MGCAIGKMNMKAIDNILTRASPIELIEPCPNDEEMKIRVKHPDELYLPGSLRLYFPEFYKEDIKHD